MIRKIIHRWRSSVAGRFVTRLFAKLNPRETQEEKRDA